MILRIKSCKIWFVFYAARVARETIDPEEQL